MKKILFLILFCFTLYAEENVTLEQNVSQNLQNNELIKDISNLDNSLKNNIWITRYANYNTYQRLIDELEKNENELKKLDKSSRRGSDIIKRIQTLKEQINLLKEYEKTPFSNMLAAPEMDTPPRITSPVALISGFSYIKKIKSDKIEYQRHIKELDTLLEKLETKENLLNRLNLIEENVQNRESLNLIKQEIGDFKAAKQIADTTYNVYEKRADEAINLTTSDIKAQFLSMGYTAIIILLTIGLTFIAKFIVKRTITDNERFYTVNKFLNVLNITIIIIILLFSYIENVTYLVTVLGFASAGIAIAMKDMFMSMLGWMVIMFGGSIHVGDRIRVLHDGSEFVGDVIDISLLRLTVFEDVSYSTYKTNRRAGRIIFVPNNYIFTDLIANYAHYGMKTIWDGIDIVISFDSNHKKAVYLARNVVKKYSKGYTDIAKRQMNKLRSQYSIKNPNVEPRIYTFFEPYGINISCWFMSNSYATLALRSTISAEIIEAFLAQDDIKIAYPTQTMFVGKKENPSDHTAHGEQESESI